MNPTPVPAPSRPSSRPRRAAAAAAGIAALAACALAVRRLGKQAERDHPPQGDFIDVRGVRLHWRQWGEAGQPLVLLHGNGALADDFEVSGLAALAQPRFRVIAFDRPGFGYSERPAGTVWSAREQADLFAEALARLGIERPIVVGHSWGTQVALHLGLDHRESVAALVLLGGYYFPTPRLDMPLLAAPALPVVGALWRHTVGPLLLRLAWPLLTRTLFAPAPVTAAFRERFPRGLALRPSQLYAAAADMAMLLPGAFMLRRRYAQLDVPTVILAGAGDRIISARGQSGRLHEILPDSRLLTSVGSGHMVHHSAPGETLRAIEAAADMAVAAAQFKALSAV